MFRSARWILRIGLAVVILAGVTVVANSADEVSIACGANNPANKIMTRFDLPQARQIWNRFPRLGLAPELEVDLPATVIVFDGPATHALLLGPAEPNADQPAVQATRENVVCVYVRGIANVYSAVDFEGFKP